MRFESQLIVNLHHLGENIELLKKLAPNNKIIFMVKADAYGHGMEAISRYAYVNKGIDCFGVASLGEGARVRKSLKALPVGKSAPEILIFSDLELDKNLDLYVEHNLIPVISSIEDLKILLADLKLSKKKFCLKFNTGMNRLGLEEKDINELILLLKKSNINQIHHLMTHFSNSYFKITENDKTNKQYEAFKKIKLLLGSEFKIKETSVSNSGAIEQQFGLGETHIRPGLMLYGPASVGGYKNQKRLWNGKIISSLKTRIIKVREVEKGTPIGYGGYVVHRDGVLITLPIGYADGILTYYSGYKFKLKGYNAKIIGRINMDLTSVFVETENLSLLEVGDNLNLWDESQEKMLDFCRQVNTTAYQIFTAVTSRIPRGYLDK